MELSQEQLQKLVEAEDWADKIGKHEIKSKPAYDQATDVLKQIKGKMKELESKRTEIVKPINDSVKNINNMFKIPMDKLKAVESAIKLLVGKYIQAEEQKRIEAQRKAEEETRKERERIEEEARLKREEAEALRAQGEEEKALELQLEAETKEEVAESVAVNPVVTEKVTKGSGVHTVTNYDIEVEDKSAFIFWAMKEERLEYIQIDVAMLKKEAKVTKGQRTWEGIKVIPRKEVRSTSY